MLVCSQLELQYAVNRMIRSIVAKGLTRQDNIGGVVSRLACLFSSAGKSRQQPEIIKNHNLVFESQGYDIHLYPFYPELEHRKAKKNYQITNSKPVLGINFVSTTLEQEQAWKSRKSVAFRFRDIAALLEVGLGTGKSVTLEVFSKVLKVRDDPQKSQILIETMGKTEGGEPKPEVKTAMAYRDYRVMYKLIQESLVDLSGWKIMMDIQKMHQMTKVEGKAKEEKDMDEFFKDAN